jgi:hypothetical protein
MCGTNRGPMAMAPVVRASLADAGHMPATWRSQAFTPGSSPSGCVRAGHRAALAKDVRARSARVPRTNGSGQMSDKHTGTCFCGAVGVEVTGAPEAMGYCHCESCRSWSAGPVNAFTLWKPGNVRIAEGAELVGQFKKTEKSERQFCTRCGGHVMTHHPGFGLTDVYAATIPTLAFVPALHVNYAETVLPMKDGLPKLKDFPSELGGSGEMLPE